MTIFVTGVLSLVAVASLGAADLSLVLDDPLTGADPVGIELTKTVTAGAFVANGWQATGSSSQIRIQLPDDLYPGPSAGAMEVDVTNWDPGRQYSSKKHQFINLYSRADGSKSRWTESGKSWWNIRGGDNYRSGDGAGFKFLYVPAGIDSRHEHRLIQRRNDWDVTRTYTFRVEWTTEKISILLDGQVLKANGAFSGRTEALQYVFLGKDNTYTGMSAADGVIYTGLRLYAETTTSVPETSRSITITSPAATSWDLSPADVAGVVDDDGIRFDGLDHRATYHLQPVAGGNG